MYKLRKLTSGVSVMAGLRVQEASSAVDLSMPGLDSSTLTSSLRSLSKQTESGVSSLSESGQAAV